MDYLRCWSLNNLVLLLGCCWLYFSSWIYNLLNLDLLIFFIPLDQSLKLLVALVELFKLLDTLVDKELYLVSRVSEVMNDHIKKELGVF